MRESHEPGRRGATFDLHACPRWTDNDLSLSAMFNPLTPCFLPFHSHNIVPSPPCSLRHTSHTHNHTCRPTGKDCYVNIEYESSVDYDLQGVIIAIPLPHLGHAPTVNQVRVV